MKVLHVKLLWSVTNYIVVINAQWFDWFPVKVYQQFVLTRRSSNLLANFASTELFPGNCQKKITAAKDILIWVGFCFNKFAHPNHSRCFLS